MAPLLFYQNRISAGLNFISLPFCFFCKWLDLPASANGIQGAYWFFFPGGTNTEHHFDILLKQAWRWLWRNSPLHHLNIWVLYSLFWLHHFQSNNRFEKSNREHSIIPASELSQWKFISYRIHDINGCFRGDHVKGPS